VGYSIQVLPMDHWRWKQMSLWETFYDFFIYLLVGSEFDTLTSDVLALILSLMVIYLIVIMPLQLLIRFLVRSLASVSNTPSYYSPKKKYNKPPKL
jgi:hypothetical protein